MYVVTPAPMMSWMEIFVNDSLKFPSMVVLVPSSSLNPEDQYYYQSFGRGAYEEWFSSEDYKHFCQNLCQREMAETCEPKTLDEINQKI